MSTKVEGGGGGSPFFFNILQGGGGTWLCCDFVLDLFCIQNLFMAKEEEEEEMYAQNLVDCNRGQAHSL